MKSVTKEKVFHVLKLVLLAVTVTLVLLSLLGTVAHASGLVDDTVNADNLYSKYPLSNYQLDFYVCKSLGSFAHFHRKHHVIIDFTA